MDIFQVLFYQPTFNLMIFFSNVFGNIGWAIIAIALLSKLLTLSMTNSQIKNAGKAKKLQAEMAIIKKKFANNKDKQTQELAKVQATALPGQLGGCISIIIFIILFVQIRSVIMDLVNRGYHAFNEVSYTQNFKKPEDSITIPEGFEFVSGKNTLKLEIVASNGNKIEKNYDFEIVKEKNVRIEEIKSDYARQTAEQKKVAQDNLVKQQEAERASDISIYNKTLDNSLVSIPISQFLIFTTESTQAHILTDNNINMTFYIRPPSEQTIDYTKAKASLNGINITDNITYTQGDPVNLTFTGMNLSRVATDFGILNLAVTGPYIVVALISGITQYFVTKLYSAGNPTANVETADDMKKKKHKKDEPQEEDFGQILAQTTKQMNFLFPAMTVLMSLGYLGGASFFPAGVTVFWTAQNVFVIIQQMVSQRKSIKHKLQHKYSMWANKFNLVKDTNNEDRQNNNKSSRDSK